MKPSRLLELLQDGGALPEVTVKASSTQDWQRILMDAHAELTRELCFYMEHHQVSRVCRRLKEIEDICAAWRTKGPKE
jgi:hypothetical protein